MFTMTVPVQCSYRLQYLSDQNSSGPAALFPPVRNCMPNCFTVCNVPVTSTYTLVAESSTVCFYSSYSIQF